MIFTGLMRWTTTRSAWSLRTERKTRLAAQGVGWVVPKTFVMSYFLPSFFLRFLCPWWQACAWEGLGTVQYRFCFLSASCRLEGGVQKTFSVFIRRENCSFSFVLCDTRHARFDSRAIAAARKWAVAAYFVALCCHLVPVRLIDRIRKGGGMVRRPCSIPSATGRGRKKALHSAFGTPFSATSQFALIFCCR